ncbi:MAG: flavodoxin-dependent (E)-4-hydroxy-3-methylbut-2-enyl-diphosphate synthase [Candidatus Riflebacteria bacterium]|nr:flavodoxin-dependent (E)-4-hydroxy-3-methylbut-2-enyl-diphosphate synthase [Candidatus Riflebacteria bacterium]
MEIKRRQSRQVQIGEVPVGGDAPITVQSMTKTDTRDIKATLSEIQRLAISGCEILRLAVLDSNAAEALREIVKGSEIPVIADIHFDHTLALSAISAGVHALRINPGNLRSQEKVREVARAARDCGIPIRIGVNAGSLDPEMRRKFGGITPSALAESALNEVTLLEKENFTDIKIAVKAFELDLTIEANKLVASRCDYPLHLGITESGLPEEGIIRSTIGISALLMGGIGDTIRVSLTGDSIEEVAVGRRILSCLGFRKFGPTVVSCPTCGRCQVPLIQMAREVQNELKKFKEPFKVAVMGCAVNGPGEAAEADFGIAGAKDYGLVFKKGKIIKTLPSSELVKGLIEEIKASLGGK